GPPPLRVATRSPGPLPPLVRGTPASSRSSDLRDAAKVRSSAPMYRLLLCTGNPGKLAELRALLPAGLRVLSLSEAGLPEDLPETGATLEENALQKARHARALSGMPCVADDTGLEVDALDGAPGVFSAR